MTTRFRIAVPALMVVILGAIASCSPSPHNKGETLRLLSKWVRVGDDLGVALEQLKSDGFQCRDATVTMRWKKPVHQSAECWRLVESGSFLITEHAGAVIGADRAGKIVAVDVKIGVTQS